MQLDDLIARYSAHEAKYGEAVPPGATDAEIEALVAVATLAGLFVDPAYIRFLKTRNGVSFDGLMLYGAGIPSDDALLRLDLVLMNQYHYTRGKATVLGTSDLDLYVAVGPDGPFRRLDRHSWDVIDEFASCGELIVSVLSKRLKPVCN